MSVVVFAGPTLPAAEIQSRLACKVLPPAAVGDVLRAVRTAPRAIALLDGVFERVLPAWHKEILWAMAQGVHFFGAASMGALRAAELHAFGMQGVGRIFEAYRDGELEGDDEVAVLHGPAEVGFAAVTEALVNVRATLEQAQAERILAPDEARSILTVAAAIHYRERTWEELLGRLDPGPAQRLRLWLPSGRVDQKRNDALTLLDRLAECMATDPAPLAVGYSFAWTDAWDALYTAVQADPADHLVLDELRLSGGIEPIRRAALLRLLAMNEVGRVGEASAFTGSGAGREQIRARHGLWRRADLDRWLDANDLDESGFATLCREESAIAGLLTGRSRALRQPLLAELRIGGGYPALAARARDKAERLAAAGLDGLTAAQSGIDLAQQLASFAETQRSDDAFEPCDLARRLDFADRADLERALLREAQYLRITRPKNGDSM